eukprot:856990-Rhodomonas_salina.1
MGMLCAAPSPSPPKARMNTKLSPRSQRVLCSGLEVPGLQKIYWTGWYSMLPTKEADTTSLSWKSRGDVMMCPTMTLMQSSQLLAVPDGTRIPSLTCVACWSQAQLTAEVRADVIDGVAATRL